MSLNRLLLKPPFIPFLFTGLPESVRWCSSSPSSNAQKRPKSFENSDNKCAERQPGSILSTFSIQEDMGKKFSTLKEVFGRFIGTSLSQEQNSVERIASAAVETVSVVNKSKSSPEDSQIDESGNSIPKTKVITDTQSCKYNISNRSDIVGGNSSSDLLDATMGSKSFGCTETGDAKSTTHSSDTIFTPDNLVTMTGSEVRKEGVSENRKQLIGTSFSEEQNSVNRIASAAVETVSEVTKTKCSPEDSQIGQSDDNIPMPKVITDTQSFKHNISKSSDMVRDNSSSDLLDATMGPKSFGSSEPGDAKNATQSSSDIVFTPENSVAMTGSEVRKEGVSENKSTSDTVWTSSLLNSDGQVASDGKRAHDSHKYVEHCRKKISFQVLEPFTDSHNNVESVTGTASSDMKLEGPSKCIDQSEVKPESRRQLEMGVSRPDFDCMSSLSHVLLGEASTKMQNDIGKVSSVIGNENPQHCKEMILDQPSTAGSDVGKKMPPSFIGSQQKQRLGKIIKNTINDKKDDVVMSQKSDTLALDGVLNTSDQTPGIDYIDGVIGCLQDFPLSSTGADNTDLSEKVGSVEMAQSIRNVKENDVKRKESSLRVDVSEKVGSVEMAQSNRNVKENDFKRKESSLTVDVTAKLTRQEDLRIPRTSCLKRVSTKNKVLVRFLDKSVKQRFFDKVFGDCGCIKRIELFPLIEGSIFRAGHVHFVTVEGSLKALTKNGMRADGYTVIVDANSFNDALTETAIPNLIGDSKVPRMLVKSPRRTIMIKELTHDISINRVKEALAFCGDGISCVFFGSSSSVAYVEFKTEDAKERAIAAYSIKVQEKQLVILRIDVPRTTVIRITGVDDTLFSDKKLVDQIMSICASSGEVVNLKLRNNGMLDVYFKLNQWPKMLSILNRLNGMEIDGHRLIAQPAPIFPPPVLKILWGKPDGRTYVKSVLRKLLQNTDLPDELSNLATTYHGVKSGSNPTRNSGAHP